MRLRHILETNRPRPVETIQRRPHSTEDVTIRRGRYGLPVTGLGPGRASVLRERVREHLHAMACNRFPWSRASQCMHARSTKAVFAKIRISRQVSTPVLRDSGKKGPLCYGGSPVSPVHRVSSSRNHIARGPFFAMKSRFEQKRAPCYGIRARNRLRAMGAL